MTYFFDSSYIWSSQQFRYGKISGKCNGRVRKGVIFATYSSLIGESSSGGKYRTRLNQLLHWLGSQFEGVVSFFWERFLVGRSTWLMEFFVPTRQESHGHVTELQFTEIHYYLPTSFDRRAVIFVRASIHTQCTNQSLNSPSFTFRGRGPVQASTATHDACRQIIMNLCELWFCHMPMRFPPGWNEEPH